MRTSTSASVREVLDYNKSLITEYGHMNNGSNSPVQIQFSNTTDEVKRVNAFEIFNKNSEGIELTPIGGTSMEFFKKFFYENPHLACMMRLQSTSLMGVQAEKVIYLVSKDPMGRMYQTPAIVPLDCFSKFQFQSGIMDVQYSFVLDGLSSDLEFDLCPKTTIIMTIFFSHKCINRTKKSLAELKRIGFESNEKRNETEYVASIIVENTSDEPKEVYLLDLVKFDEYSKDENLKIGSIFDMDYKRTCETFDCYKRYFNSVRIFAIGVNQLNQISKPIEFNSGNNYYPATEVDGKQFQLGINDLNIIGEELSCENPMKVMIMPKTRVTYLFKKVKDLKPTSVDNSFVNVFVENTIDESRKVNILSYYGNDKEKNLIHSIGRNKLSFNSDKFEFNFMRIQFSNHEQVESPIVIETTDLNGVSVTQTVYPINYFNEHSMSSNIVEIPLYEMVSLKNSKIIVELNKKSDGMNVILTNKKESFGFDKLIPIWIENTNSEPIKIELVSNISDHKDLPDGVNCSISDNVSYKDLLSEISNNNYVSLDIMKTYSKNTSQIIQIFSIVDYTNPESQTEQPIVTRSYFSANQFQNCLLSYGNGIKAFDLSKNEKSELIKKNKVTFTVLGKTKLAVICNLKKN